VETKTDIKIYIFLIYLKFLKSNQNSSGSSIHVYLCIHIHFLCFNVSPEKYEHRPIFVDVFCRNKKMLILLSRNFAVVKISNKLLVWRVIDRQFVTRSNLIKLTRKTGIHCQPKKRSGVPSYKNLCTLLGGEAPSRIRAWS
jgi:hypothetical protein